MRRLLALVLLLGIAALAALLVWGPVVVEKSRNRLTTPPRAGRSAPRPRRCTSA
ncbi:hypothetical protein QWZ10_04500 [Paracoccus cavernae]|uniref:Uncharacterized protein n=1 Tax=Paracoccus cavernae TaxID=1571207 RepID=A0ABT8D478_9RHOB|nr:hypothetical protein [Paracoccus cavernae]